MSQQLVVQYGAKILGEALSGKSAAIQKAGNIVYGLGAQYGVMLPFSRKHETEADYMGLILMTIAGYNPNGPSHSGRRCRRADRVQCQRS